MKAAALHRREREELYDRLVKEGVIKCRSGFLVYYSGDVYYVTGDGDVFRLKYRRTGLMEAVLKIAKGGRLKRLAEVKDERNLMMIAKILGKVCPKLVLVILP